MTKKNKETVAAVVVTFNRKELLKECLDSLLKQTRMSDSIIIMNNASTDGTEEMLKKEYLDNPIFDYVNLGENLGGAGGFYYGMKRAYEKGFDWIWVMDDDVEAKEDALDKLLDFKDRRKVAFLCSKVVGINGGIMNTPEIDRRPNSNLYPCWGDLLEKGVIKVRENTFVSIVFNKKIIKQKGLPIKEFFIWGDDYEYTLRLTSSLAGSLIGESVVVHKRAIQKPPNILRETDVKRIKNFFYQIRNSLYIQKKYRKKINYLYAMLVNFKLIFLCLFSFNHPLLKAKMIISAIIASIFFNPKIRFPKNEA